MEEITEERSTKSVSGDVDAAVGCYGRRRRIEILGGAMAAPPSAGKDAGELGRWKRRWRRRKR
jgi:hypothetical protein